MSFFCQLHFGAKKSSFAILKTKIPRLKEFLENVKNLLFCLCNIYLITNHIIFLVLSFGS